MLNMCSNCLDSRRTAVRLPRLVTARDQAQTALDVAGGLACLLLTVLRDYVAGFDKIITDLQTKDPARA